MGNSFTAPHERTARMWKVRAGVAKTFGSLFLVFSVLLVMLGTMLLYDAYAHPLAAEGGQVLMGSVSLAFALLLFGYLWRSGR